MCAGACVWARIGAVVYGVSQEDIAAYGCKRGTEDYKWRACLIPCRLVFEKGNHTSPSPAVFSDKNAKNCSVTGLHSDPCFYVMKGRHIAARKFKSSVAISVQFSGGGCVLLLHGSTPPSFTFDPFPQFLLYGLHRRREPAGPISVVVHLHEGDDRSVFLRISRGSSSPYSSTDPRFPR